jgi:hypothetical protein
MSAASCPKYYACYELATVLLEPCGPNTDCLATFHLAFPHTHTHTLSLSLSLSAAVGITTHTHRPTFSLACVLISGMSLGYFTSLFSELAHGLTLRNTTGCPSEAVGFFKLAVSFPFPFFFSSLFALAIPSAQHQQDPLVSSEASSLDTQRASPADATTSPCLTGVCTHKLHLTSKNSSTSFTCHQMCSWKTTLTWLVTLSISEP